MHRFEYVTKGQAAPVKKDLIAILNAVQDILRNDFTFRYDFIGSSSRNMITREVNGNIGFDFDINVEINDSEPEHTPKQIREMLKRAFDRIAPQYGYSDAEQSTRVLTIKFKDTAHSKILHSCDIAVVNNYTDEDGYEGQQYIRYEKKSNRYVWAEQPEGYYMLQEKVEWIDSNDLRPELRELYLRKKCENTNRNNKSRVLYAQAVHEICQKYGYFD